MAFLLIDAPHFPADGHNWILTLQVRYTDADDPIHYRMVEGPAYEQIVADSAEAIREHLNRREGAGHEMGAD